MSDNVSKVAQLTADTTDRGLQQLEDGYRVRRSARSQIFAPVGIKAQASVSAKPATNQSTPLKAKLNKPKPSTRLKTKGLNPRHILISTGDTTSRNKPQNHDRLPEESFGSKQSHILTLKLSREKLVAILVRPTKVAVANAPCFGTAQPTIFSTIPAKRSLSSDNSVEDFGPLEFISPKKRQRRPTKLASNASPEETNPPAPSVESRPEPVGEPPAWSVTRQGICEALDWYRAYQSGPYHVDGLGYGYLLDKDCGERGYMDSEVVITRSGGGCENDEEGIRRQTIDHDRNAASVASFINSMDKKLPIGLITGQNNEHCPTKPLHRYSVLDWFVCTDIWAELSNAKICFKQRFEKIDLDHKSWWAPKGAPNSPPERDFTTKALRHVCIQCGQKSPQVFSEGWMCLRESCKLFWTINYSAPPQELTYNIQFLKERTRFADPGGVGDLVPELPDPDSPDAPFSTERNSWRGIVCPKCRSCISRKFWDSWRCETEGCNFVLKVKHQIHSAGSLLPDNQREYSGRALPLNKFWAPVIEPEEELFGCWRIQKFTVFPGNTITHFMSNGPINQKPAGAHQMLRELQTVDLDLRRLPLSACEVKGSLTNHFTSNYGMPYKFVVAQDSKPFKDAPKVVLNALSRMTWAGHKVVTDGSFKDFNELLVLGYFEKQKISWHDDGEKDLEGTIATMSIGGNATMALRMKNKYYSAHRLMNLKTTYDPMRPVIPGMQGWEDRMRLNELFGKVNQKEFDKAKERFFQNIRSGKYGKSGTPSPVIKLKLKHGDITVMDGKSLQKYFVHQVEPDGKLRYALTVRFVKPENIDEGEHWKAKFHIDTADMYDGDPNIIQEIQAMKAGTAPHQAAVMEDAPAITAA